MPDYLVSPAAAAKAAGIAKSSIRNYVTNALYSGMFSASAQQTPRQFTTDDVRLMRFIATQTHAGRDHDAIVAMIRAGALAQDDWQPPQVTQQLPQAELTQQPGSALVLASAMGAELERYHTMQNGLTAALVEATRELARAEARIQTMQEELEYLRAQVDNSAQIAHLQAQLEAAKKPASLLARLLGRKG